MRILHWDDINPHTGRPYTWDDVNLRWGDPSFALEPGDPGFVPYPLSAVTKPKTKTSMKHNRWYPVRTSEQLGWLGNFVAKLGNHATPLGLTPAQLADAIADARWLDHILGSWLPAVRAWQQACTEYVEAATFGPGGPAVFPVFVPPPLPGEAGSLPAVVVRDEGALDRLFALVGDIKDAATPTIAEDLRIVGTEAPGPDFNVFGPKLKVKKTVTGIDIDWSWQGQRDFLDQCEIEVDRGDGQGWRLLTMDTTPGCLDSQPFPTALTRWKYRAIYRVSDARVGQWSAETPETSVTVGG